MCHFLGVKLFEYCRINRPAWDVKRPRRLLVCSMSSWSPQRDLPAPLIKMNPACKKISCGRFPRIGQWRLLLIWLCDLKRRIAQLPTFRQPRSLNRANILWLQQLQVHLNKMLKFNYGKAITTILLTLFYANLGQLPGQLTLSANFRNKHLPYCLMRCLISHVKEHKISYRKNPEIYWMQLVSKYIHHLSP